MSAGTKAGLVFFLPQLVIMICATILGFVPVFLLAGNPAGLIGCCVVPIAALLMAMPAGYFAAKWHPDRDEITGQAVSAGVVAGIGALVGSVLFWVLVGGLFSTMVDDAALRQILSQMRDIQPDIDLDVPALRRGLSFAIWGTAAFGVVTGLLSLVFSLIGSLLGMSIARSSLPVPPIEHSLPQ
jgi:hypothetical protein